MPIIKLNTIAYSIQACLAYSSLDFMFLGSALPQYELFPPGSLPGCLVQLAKICSPNLISVTARLDWPQLPYSTVSGARLRVRVNTVYNSIELSIVRALPTAAMCGILHMFHVLPHVMSSFVFSYVSPSFWYFNLQARFAQKMNLPQSLGLFVKLIKGMM